MHLKLKLLATVFATGASLVAVAVAFAASSPAISTSRPSSVTSSSAVLNGLVNPNGSATSYRFAYGLTNAYGLATSIKSAGGGTKAVSVHSTVASLLPGTLYHFQLLALNKFGGATSADRTFTTGGNPPPAAATGPAAQISTSSATVTGIINPHGEKTTWVFQYGLTSFYGVQTFGGTVLAGATPVPVAEQLPGLEAGTTFHYRIVALHGSSVVQNGSDATFLTFPSPRPAPRVHAATSPHRAKSAPYVFATSGKVIGPSSIPQSVSCFGNATARFLLGKRQVALSLLPLQPDCSFSAETAFNHLPGHGKKNRKVHLRIQIRFGGNGYLAPSDARAESVTLG